VVEPISLEGNGGAEGCVEALERAILKGGYPAGTRLPAERELAEQLGVNRITVRSALAQLKAARLISVRQGSGYLVKNFWREGGIEVISRLLELDSRPGRARAMVEDLLEVRRALARVLLRRLMGGSAREHLEAIESAIEQFEAAVRTRRPPEELAELDLEVVAALAAASGSEVLMLCVNPVARVLTGLPSLQRAMYRDPERNVAGFRAMQAWLSDGGRGEHIDPVIDAMQAVDRETVATFARARRNRA
jgi:GntR family transcriptional repressor for pyruvate dehydrogenase complex